MCIYSTGDGASAYTHGLSPRILLYLPPERRTLFGVAENTVRLSVGIEPVDQLIDDLGQALVHAGSEKGPNP